MPTCSKVDAPVVGAHTEECASRRPSRRVRPNFEAPRRQHLKGSGRQPGLSHADILFSATS